MEKIVEGPILHESVHCITIEKTYLGGFRGGVTFRHCDVEVVKDGDRATAFKLNS